MKLLEREAPAPLLRWEATAVCLVAWAAFLSIPLTAGALGLSWDALNHHIYLGWTAEHPRFDRDYLAAGYQSYQFPYLYWPVYKLAVTGWTGAAAGAVLATLAAFVVPPLWMLARACAPGTTVFDVVLRALAVALALLTSVVISVFDSSQNDLLAAVPLVWAVGLAMEPLARPMTAQAVRRCVLASGVMAGLSVAAKLSNGPIAILLPALWLLAGPNLRGRLLGAALGCGGLLAAFLLAYGYWGLQLWQHFGNPFFPFLNDWLAPLRAARGAG